MLGKEEVLLFVRRREYSAARRGFQSNADAGRMKSLQWEKEGDREEEERGQV